MGRDRCREIVASQSRCIDEQDCDEVVASMKQG
jgi:hypothetical protein